MNIKELIKKLKKFDENNLVFIQGQFQNYHIFQSPDHLWKGDDGIVRIQFKEIG